jgi:hypothetical protein
LLGLTGYINSLEVNVSEVSRWNSESTSVNINTLKELFDVVDTSSDSPFPFELTSHLLVPGSSENEILHRILETGVELFSFIVNGFTESGGFESISIFITRGKSLFSSILSGLDFSVVHQVFLILLGAPNNLESWVVVNSAGSLLGDWIDDGILSIRIATLDAITITLEEETFSTGFAVLKTRSAHTFELSCRELFDLSHDISASHVLLKLKLFLSWLVITILVSLVTEVSFVGGGEESEFLAFLGLLFVSRFLGLREDLFDTLIHVLPGN